MKTTEFWDFVKLIVEKSNSLKNKYTEEDNAAVNYACIFAQSESEYKMYNSIANELGEIVLDTKTGPLYKVSPIETVSGPLQLVKVRKPDPTRTELGDADFTIVDYLAFKEKYIDKAEFKLIERPGMEMIEIKESNCDILVYFSYPPLDKQLGLI